MGRYWPDVREKVAQGRWSDVPRTGVTTLVSACPQSAEALSQTVPEGYQFKDLFVLLSERIGNVVITLLGVGLVVVIAENSVDIQFLR